MVELIIVIILIGVLSAIGASRFFSRSTYDAAAFAEQSRSMLRYAQKLAIAQNRPVYVQGALDGVALCFDAVAPCLPANQVPVPAGENSGTQATRSRCLASGKYAPNWYCEGWPAGVTMDPGATTFPTFFFNGLGQPGIPGGTFDGLTVTILADGASSRVSVARETGYVN